MAEEITTSSEEVLKDEGMVQIQEGNTPPQAPAPETPTTDPAPLEINSLGEAMQAFNAAKSKAAEPTVPEGTPAPEASVDDGPAADGGGDAGIPADGVAQPADNAGVISEGTDQAAQTIPGEPGGAAVDNEVYDAEAGIADVRRELVGITQDAVRKKFAEQKKNKININDLMKVDENSGTKEFINPDTGRPFSSSNPRSEAQNFINDYNAGLDQEFAAACRQLYPDVERSYAPIIKFHQFLPTWQQMDPFRQEMFEELVAGHELKDRQGNIVAYNCDLNAVNQQMEKQIQWLLSKQQAMAPAAAPAAETNPVTQPAVAAKTSTQKAKVDDKEYDLSDMGDALKYYNKKKKEKGPK